MCVFWDTNVLFDAEISPTGRRAALSLLAEHGVAIW
jgi:hypothetical protein